MTAPRPEPLEGLAEAIAKRRGDVYGACEAIDAEYDKDALAALDHLEKAAEAEASLGHAARYPDNPVLAEQAARWLRAFKGRAMPSAPLTREAMLAWMRAAPAKHYVYKTQEGRWALSYQDGLVSLEDVRKLVSEGVLVPKYPGLSNYAFGLPEAQWKPKTQRERDRYEAALRARRKPDPAPEEPSDV